MKDTAVIEKTIPDFDPIAIAQSGQCFRMNKTAPDTIDIVAFQKHLRIIRVSDNRFLFTCDDEEFTKFWMPYFDLDTDYSKIMSLCDREDCCLSAAIKFGRGLRILRQEPWETLISFIISQRKNIPAIKNAIESLCQEFGELVEDGYGKWRSFPSPQSILLSPGFSLASCKLGYREKYVISAARAVAEGELDFSEMAIMRDAQLYQRLTSVFGVGPKVANCIMLFGFHRLNVCPVDVWIRRIVDTEYKGEAPFDKYPEYAGVMQQYLFNYRKQLKGHS